MDKSEYIGFRASHELAGLVFDLRKKTGLSITEIARRGIAAYAGSLSDDAIKEIARHMAEIEEREQQREKSREIITRACLFVNQRRIISNMERGGISKDGIDTVKRQFEAEAKSWGLTYRHKNREAALIRRPDKRARCKA